MNKLNAKDFTLTITQEGEKFLHVVTYKGKMVTNKKSKKPFTHVGIALDKFGLADFGYTTNEKSLKSNADYIKNVEKNEIIVLTF